MRFVNGRGRTTSGFPVEVFRRLTEGRFISLPRGDLAAMIYHANEGRVEIDLRR